LETTLIYSDFVRDGALRAQFDQHNADTDGPASSDAGA